MRIGIRVHVRRIIFCRAQIYTHTTNAPLLLLCCCCCCGDEGYAKHQWKKKRNDKHEIDRNSSRQN
jgi:hypothetical protein